MTKLAVFGFALCVAGCLRLAPVGLGSDQPPGESEISPDAANAQGASTDGAATGLAADAYAGTSTSFDAGPDGEQDEDDELEPNDEQDSPDEEQADDDDGPQGAEDSS